MLGCGPAPPRDAGDSVLAQTHLAADQVVAAALRHEGEDPRGEAIGVRPLPGMAAEPLAFRLRGRQVGADALADEPALELGDVRDGRRKQRAEPLIAITDTRRASNSYSVCSRSSVLRPQRDSSVTRTASISRRCASASTFRPSTRATLVPEPVSLNTPATS